jgi:ATP adenylyltransferase
MPRYTFGMDHLWTPWRYRYVTGAENRDDRRLGVPPALASFYKGDKHCVFCNLLGSVDAAISGRMPQIEAEKAALLLHRYENCYICLNAYPYSTGHIMIVPYAHLDSLAQMPVAAAQEMMHLAQRVDGALRTTYQPEGLNFGLNLGQAAGAGVAEHLHLHALPRWLGDTNFMTTTAETRVLPEPLDVTWQKLRDALA